MNCWQSWRPVAGSTAARNSDLKGRVILWLRQNSNGKWPYIEILDLSIEKIGSFHSYVNVYQRVKLHFPRVFPFSYDFPMDFLWFHNGMVRKEGIHNGPTFLVRRTFKFGPSLVKRSTFMKYGSDMKWDGLEAYRIFIKKEMSRI